MIEPADETNERPLAVREVQGEGGIGGDEPSAPRLAGRKALITLAALQSAAQRSSVDAVFAAALVGTVSSDVKDDAANPPALGVKFRIAAKAGSVSQILAGATTAPEVPGTTRAATAGPCSQRSNRDMTLIPTDAHSPTMINRAGSAGAST